MNDLKGEKEGAWQKDTELNVHCALSIRRIIAWKGFKDIIKYIIPKHESLELKCTLPAEWEYIYRKFIK